MLRLTIQTRALELPLRQIMSQTRQTQSQTGPQRSRGGRGGRARRGGPGPRGGARGGAFTTRQVPTLRDNVQLNGTAVAYQNGHSNGYADSEMESAEASPAPPGPSTQSDTLLAHVTSTRFDSFVKQGLLDSRISIPFETCTDVQAKTMPIILQGNDVLAQAKTGTGKTVAFLVPAIQRLLRSNTARAPGQIGILVISPTRELATQIADEAKILLRGLPNIGVCTATGGNNLNTELRNIRQGRADILVATPGRLQDYLENHKFTQNVSTLEALILDEADRLLDQGFKPAIIAINKLLPKRSERLRQSLLFSATISEEVKQVASAVLTSNYTFISTLNEDELNVHQHVPQFVVSTSLSDTFATTVAVLREEIAHTPNSKIMLFFPTARSTGLFYELLTHLPRGALGKSTLTGNFEILQIHSRMSQSARSKSADVFKDATSGVLVSSDVTARGMDFPRVTLVLQVGIPQNPEQYIHRLGRTARAGQGGRGILILTRDEQAFLHRKEIKDLPIKPASVDEANLRAAAQECDAALDKVSTDAKSSAYAAWLGYYKGFGKVLKWSVPQLIEQGRIFALEACKYKGDRPGQTPPLLVKTIGMMGLRDYRSSFNVVSELPNKPKSTPRGGQGGRKQK